MKRDLFRLWFHRVWAPLQRGRFIDECSHHRVDAPSRTNCRGPVHLPQIPRTFTDCFLLFRRLLKRRSPARSVFPTSEREGSGLALEGPHVRLLVAWGHRWRGGQANVKGLLAGSEIPAQRPSSPVCLFRTTRSELALAGPTLVRTAMS